VKPSIALVFWLLLEYQSIALPITCMDADNQSRTLNELGKVSVIISSTQETQKQTRETGMILDEFQGQKDFREIVLVDLQGGLGNLVPMIVRMEMRKNLDIEAKRITPFFIANGNKENPRLYTVAIPDFDGRISAAVGWSKPQTAVTVVVFDRSGEASFRWSSVENPEILKSAVRKLFSK